MASAVSGGPLGVKLGGRNKPTFGRRFPIFCLHSQEFCVVTASEEASDERKEWVPYPLFCVSGCLIVFPFF